MKLPIRRIRQEIKHERESTKLRDGVLINIWKGIIRSNALSTWRIMWQLNTWSRSIWTDDRRRSVGDESMIKRSMYLWINDTSDTDDNRRGINGWTEYTYQYYCRRFVTLSTYRQVRDHWRRSWRTFVSGGVLWLWSETKCCDVEWLWPSQVELLR